MNYAQQFSKMFLKYSAAIIIPVFIIGFTTIGYLFSKLAEDTKQLNLNIMNQTKNVVDSSLTDTVVLSQQIQNSDIIKQFIQGSKGRDEINSIELLQVAREISRWSKSNIIKTIGIYSKKTDILIEQASIYSLSEYYGKSLEIIGQSEEWWREKLEAGGSRPMLIGFESAEGRLIVLLMPVERFVAGSGGAVFITTVNADLLLNRMFPMLEGGHKAFAIINREGDTILKTADFNGETAGNIFEVKSDILSMKYVFEFPKTALTGNVYSLAGVFVLLLLLGLAASGLLAMYGMRKLRKPIIDIYNENRHLSEDLNVQVKNIQDKMIVNYLNNEQTAESWMTDVISWHGTGLSGERFGVAIVGCEGDIRLNYRTDYANPYDSIKKLEESLRNNTQGHISYRHIVLFGKDIFVLGYDDGSDIQVLFENAIKNVGPETGASFYVGIGVDADSLNGIWKAYETALAACYYAYDDKRDVIVYNNDIAKKESVRVQYTKEQGLSLIRSIKNGSADKTTGLLDKIYNANFVERQLAQSNLKKLISRITSTLYDLIDEAYPESIEKRGKFDRICQNLLQNRNMQESFDIIREVCNAICETFARRKSDDEIRDDILKYIEGNYMNSDLSLNSVAQFMNMNYFYFSSLFKEKVGSTFLVYLTALRMKKSKELLESSDLSVKEVAERVGFIGSDSFIRAYKKYYKTTPKKHINK